MSDNRDKIQLKGRWQFVENILGLSLTKDADRLHEEWKFQRKFEDPNRNGQCICGTSHLKYGFRFSNSSTGHVIMTGKECAKKLKLHCNGSVNNKFISAFMNGDVINGSWTAFTKITDIYNYSLDQRADWKELLDKELKFLYSKSLKQIESLVVELKDFHDVLQRNAISDPKLVDMIRQVEKRQEGLIKYREERREKARQDAAHNAELYRVAFAKHIKEKEEEKMKRLEEEAREKEQQRKEAEKQSIVKRQPKIAKVPTPQAERKCACGNSLLAQVCTCKFPQFTQRTLVGNTILCSKCQLKKCDCN